LVGCLLYCLFVSLFIAIITVIGIIVAVVAAFAERWLSRRRFVRVSAAAANHCAHTAQPPGPLIITFSVHHIFVVVIIIVIVSQFWLLACAGRDRGALPRRSTEPCHHRY
jgi:hypothetical protein